MKDTFEEKIVEMAEKKLLLDSAVIGGLHSTLVEGGEEDELGQVALSSLLGFGAKKILNAKDNEMDTYQTPEVQD